MEIDNGPVGRLARKVDVQPPHLGEASLDELVERWEAGAIVGVGEEDLEIEETGRDVGVAILEDIVRNEAQAADEPIMEPVEVLQNHRSLLGAFDNVADVRCSLQLKEPTPCLLDCLVIADELDDVALWIADVKRPPTAPAMFNRRGLDSETQQPSQFGIKVSLVDFEREMMQRGR